MEFNGRLIIKGQVEVCTGLHIGTGGAAGIGLVDNPVIRDPLTGRPIIPGSSLKGRLRHATEILLGDAAKDEIGRLFGTAPEDDIANATRLYVRDCHLDKESVDKLMSLRSDSFFVEVKSENRISRDSGVAEHPRQSERLPAGTVLSMELVYNVYEPEQVLDDLQNLEAALSFVEDEYLGGSGSRGYGKVNLHLNSVTWKSRKDYLDGKTVEAKTIDRSNWINKVADMIKLPQKARS